MDLNGDGVEETKARLTIPKNRPWNNVLFSELTVYRGGDLGVVGYYGCDTGNGAQQMEIGVTGKGESWGELGFDIEEHMADVWCSFLFEGGV